MVNWGILGGAGLTFIISLVFFFSSFSYVDAENNFTTGGLVLFVAGLFGFIFSIFLVYRGVSD